MEGKIVRTPGGIEVTMARSASRFYACAGCGTDLGPGKLYAVCADCGGMFCETCVTDGTFEGHECDDGDGEDW